MVVFCFVIEDGTHHHIMDIIQNKKCVYVLLYNYFVSTRY